jgi:very-short-patch-repair endonuclease
MRRESTPAERIRWHALRDRQLNGLKFRRQVPFGAYIVDFYCPEVRLVIEIDGATHVDSPTDTVRDGWFRGQGIVVLRFWNNEVMGNLEGILLLIREVAGHPLPLAPSRKGRGT